MDPVHLGLPTHFKILRTPLCNTDLHASQLFVLLGQHFVLDVLVRERGGLVGGVVGSPALGQPLRPEVLVVNIVGHLHARKISWSMCHSFTRCR